MVDFFNKVPREIDETALIDGCNPYQAFYKVVLPNSIPGFNCCWNVLYYIWMD